MCYGRTLIPANAQIVVGQRLHCILYGGRDGIVFRIDSPQEPASVRQLGGGIVITGGRATFDVVFDNGGISRAVPECIVRGVQWRLYDSVATSEEIGAALHFAEHEEARKATAKREAEERRARERQEHAAKNPHLVMRADKPKWGPGRTAAENIRRELKRAFPGIKFSVTSDWNSVDVRWTNGPTSRDVEKITGKYRAGRFDGMTDCYEFDADATFGDVFGDPQYVSCQRASTTEGVRAAWVANGGDAAEVPDNWEQGGRWKLPEMLGDAIFRAWCETSLGE